MTCDPNQSGEWPDRDREDAGARVCRTCGGAGWEWSQETSGIKYLCPACGGTGEEESDGG